MKLIKYFLQKRSVTLLLLLLIFFGGLFAYAKMGKLEDAPFTIKQALVLTPYSGASPSEVQSQVTDVLEEAIQSLGELYYLKTENRAGLSKITVYVKKEIRADEMQQLWDKLRRKVGDVQSKLPAGAGPSVVNDDFGDVLGVFYGLTGEGHTYRELEEQAKQIKNELLKTKDVAKIEIYGVQTPTIDIHISPSIMAREQIGMAIDNLNKITDQTTLEIQTAQVALQQALGQVNLCTASLDKAYENEQKALEKYNEGEISILEIIDAQTYYQTAQLNYIQAKTSAQYRYSDLLRALQAYETE